MICWKRWAAKHECEVVKERVSLEPIQAMLRRKTGKSLADKHRNLMRKLVVEGGWVQKRLCDTWWSDEKKCEGCNKEGTEKHRLNHFPSRREVRNQIPGGEMGAESNVQGGVAKRHHIASSERRYLKERPCVRPKLGRVKGFWNHIATDGSFGVSGRWSACGSVMQLDHDVEMGPMGCTGRWRQGLRCSVPSRGLS